MTKTKPPRQAQPTHRLPDNAPSIGSESTLGFTPISEISLDWLMRRPAQPENLPLPHSHRGRASC